MNALLLREMHLACFIFGRQTYKRYGISLSWTKVARFDNESAKISRLCETRISCLNTKRELFFFFTAKKNEGFER